jgi:hypothetical protein
MRVFKTANPAGVKPAACSRKIETAAGEVCGVSCLGWHAAGAVLFLMPENIMDLRRAKEIRRVVNRSSSIIINHHKNR